MPEIKMYTGAFCPYCTMAKQFLSQLGVQQIEEIRVDKNPDEFANMQQITGQRSVPQIFIGDTHGWVYRFVCFASKRRADAAFV